MLISALQQSDSVVCIYILFHILFHDSLSQDAEYSSLCYTVGPCSLSILYTVVGLCQFQPPQPTPPLTRSLFATASLFSVSVSLFLFTMKCFDMSLDKHLQYLSTPKIVMLCSFLPANQVKTALLGAAAETMSEQPIRLNMRGPASA